MRLTLEDYVAPSINPNLNLIQSPIPSNEVLDATLTDPALEFQTVLEALDPGSGPGQIAKEVARQATWAMLQQQQYVTYDMGAQLGVLTPFVDPTRLSLKAFDVVVYSLDSDALAEEIARKAIGIAGETLSAIPNMYTQIAGALIGLGTSVWDAIRANRTIEAPRQYLPCQQWSEEVDSYVFGNIRKLTKSGYDWTPIFIPRYEGQLTLQICRSSGGEGPHSLMWGLGNGQIPHVRKVYEGGGYDLEFGQDGQFDPSGGIGMIPGGQRIYGLVQQTVINNNDPTYDKNHPTAFNWRCAAHDVAMLDLGLYYPSAAQTSTALWGYMFQRGAAMYAVDTGIVGDAWIRYFESMWDGISMLWANPEFQGRDGKNGKIGYGAGVWDAALSDLCINYGVGAYGDIGGIGTWQPAQCRGFLQSEDEEHFISGSALTQIILPAVAKLAQAQRWHLQHTTIAAYLPVFGGKSADPVDQNGDAVMGAFRSSPQLRQEFKDARVRILQGPLKYEVRLQDVLDATYRQQIEDAGGGIWGEGQLGFSGGEGAGFSGVWVPTGGAGFDGKSPPGRMPRPRDSDTVMWVLGALAVAGGAAAAYRYRDPLQKWMRQVQRKALPGRR